MVRAFLAAIPWEQGESDKWEGDLGWESGGLIAWPSGCVISAKGFPSLVLRLLISTRGV